jgi:hypothetical protein
MSITQEILGLINTRITETFQPDYDSEKTPETVRALKPHIYKNHNSWCAVYVYEDNTLLLTCDESPEAVMQKFHEEFYNILNRGYQNRIF